MTWSVSRRRMVPSAAKWLGVLGAIPFVACTVITVIGSPDLAEKASSALAIYGAIILSFLGGIQWGLAINDEADLSSLGAPYRRLTISVMPALIGWLSLLLPRDIGFVVLALAFALVLMVDLRAARNLEAPAWYPRLRWPLSLTVITALAVGVLA